MNNFYFIFSGLWRRCFGEGSIPGILGNRAVQAIIFILVTTQLYWTNHDSFICLAMAISVSTWMYAQFWSRAVGAFLDYGKTKQDASKYNRWFRIPLDYIYNRIGKEKYVGSYDFWYCELRYTLCMLPMCYFSWWYILCGLIAAPIYWGVDFIYSYVWLNYPQYYPTNKWWDCSKNVSEIIHGSIVGLIMQLVIWGTK